LQERLGALVGNMFKGIRDLVRELGHGLLLGALTVIF
jgi:hypothetical protein